MGRRLRYLPTGALVEVTCRTVQGRMLLRPSHRFNQLALGVLGRAQAKYAMRIHAFVVLSTHMHLLLSPQSPQQLAGFMAFVEANLAKEVGRLNDWSGSVWSRRYQAIAVSDEECAQVARLLYLLRHGVKEHLVPRPQDWPGPHAVNSLLDGTALAGLWIDRTLQHRLGRKGRSLDSDAAESREVVRLSPLPCWQDLSAEEYRARVKELVAEVEAEGRRLAREQGPCLGADRVLRQNPTERPPQTRRSPAALFHAASRAARQVLIEAYRAFVAAYRTAAARLRAGDRLVRFPDRSFPPPLPAGG